MLDGSGNVKTRYVKGINNLARLDSEGNSSYILYDGHGDVAQTVSSADGKVENKYEYDEFGNTTLSEEKYVMDFKYSGYQFDNETGKYYLQARYYDPETGRFISEDTYTGKKDDPLSLNLYTYCENDPLDYWDYSGHRPIVGLNNDGSAIYGSLNNTKKQSTNGAKPPKANKNTSATGAKNNGSNNQKSSGKQAGSSVINTIKDSAVNVASFIVGYNLKDAKQREEFKEDAFNFISMDSGLPVGELLGNAAKSTTAYQKIANAGSKVASSLVKAKSVIGVKALQAGIKITSIVVDGAKKASQFGDLLAKAAKSGKALVIDAGGKLTTYVGKAVEKLAKLNPTRYKIESVVRSTGFTEEKSIIIIDKKANADAAKKTVEKTLEEADNAVDSLWSPAAKQKDLWSKGKLKVHYEKHGISEFGAKSSKEYSDMAYEFGTRKFDSIIQVIEGPYVYRYEPSTNNIFV